MAGVKGKSGRKRKDSNTRQVQQTMTEAAVYGAKLIRDFVRGKDKHGNKVSITMVKLTACLQSIAHGIGLPKQKLEVKHTGEQLTLKDLAQLAQSGDKSGESLLQNADKSDVKPFQNAGETDEEVVNVPTKPMKETSKMSKN